MRILSSPVSLLVVASCLSSGFVSAAATGQPKAIIREFNLIAPNPVPELQQVAALQATVSLEAKRTPLTKVLAEIQKQSRVVFKSGDDFPAAKTLVTLRLKEMTLASLMGSFSRIYGVRWMEEKGAWTMRASDKSTLSVQLLRSIGVDGRFTPQKMQIAAQQQAELIDEVYNSVDLANWQSPDGVPLSDLPPEVLQRLREYVDESQRPAIIERELERVQLSQQPLVLRLGKIALDTPTLFANDANRVASDAFHDLGYPQLAIYSADGRFVTNVFPAFGPAPKPEPEQIAASDASSKVAER